MIPPPGTDAFEAMVSWTYGNLASSTNHKPESRAFVRKVVEQMYEAQETKRKAAK